MKILFICLTEFQLFNALNLKLHVFPLDKADIILQFLKKDTVDFYHRIKETGLFENVCYRLPDFLAFMSILDVFGRGIFLALFWKLQGIPLNNSMCVVLVLDIMNI